MSTHSYSRCWLHLIWETLRREPMLDNRAAPIVSEHLYTYCFEKGIYMKINYFNTDHTHALIDLPTNLTIEQVVHCSKEVHRIGLMRIVWSKGASLGDEVMVPSRFRTPTLI